MHRKTLPVSAAICKSFRVVTGAAGFEHVIRGPAFGRGNVFVRRDGYGSGGL